MIEQLTAEQESRLDDYKTKWLDIGMSTKEINVEKSLEALGLAYEAAGLVAPTKYEVYDSPFEAIQEMKLRYDIDITHNDFMWGAHDAGWLSFYDFFHKECGIEECGKLTGLINLAEHCGWVLAFDEMIVLTRKPVTIKMDEDDQTHCEDGLAIQYRDGTGVAIWHGTQIPKEWIFDKSSITPDVLFQWENVEQRRAACEIIGWANVLTHLKGKVIDKDPDPTIGTLLEVELPDSGKEKFLIATDPNVQKEVGIPVPSEMQTALEANSWTYGIDKFEFKPEFRV